MQKKTQSLVRNPAALSASKLDLFIRKTIGDAVDFVKTPANSETIDAPLLTFVATHGKDANTETHRALKEVSWTVAQRFPSPNSEMRRAMQFDAWFRLAYEQLLGVLATDGKRRRYYHKQYSLFLAYVDENILSPLEQFAGVDGEVESVKNSSASLTTQSIVELLANKVVALLTRVN